MHSLIKKLLVVVVFVSLGAISNRAEAGQASGYICYFYHPHAKSVTYGDHGYLIVSIYSDPACDGNYMGNYMIYTTGATNSWSNPDYYYSEARLLHTATSFQRAMIHDQRIAIYYPNAYPNQIQSVMYWDK